MPGSGKGEMTAWSLGYGGTPAGAYTMTHSEESSRLESTGAEWAGLASEAPLIHHNCTVSTSLLVTHTNVIGYSCFCAGRILSEHL